MTMHISHYDYVSHEICELLHRIMCSEVLAEIRQASECDQNTKPAGIKYSENIGQIYPRKLRMNPHHL